MSGRSARHRPQRGRTISGTALRQLVASEPLEPAISERPLTRGECAPGGPHEARPCPFVGCRYNLYLDVNPATGALKLNYPDVEPGDLSVTCALDVADDGAHTLEWVGDVLGLVRERARQIEVRALHRAREAAEAVKGAA